MKTLFITTALALFAAPALAETKSQWGCEWQKASNGNYWFKTDGGCKHWIGLGYATQASMNKDVPAATEDAGEGPSDPGDGAGPGDDNAGPGDGGSGAGDEGPGRDKPGKPGKGKGRR